MPPHEESIREKIILATIECIEKEGLHSVTIRGIAREAGVNTAAINYYFRSKENLINATLQQTIDHSLMDLKEILEDTTLPPRTIIRSFLMYLLEGSLRYPEMTKAHFYDPIIRNKYHPRFTRWIEELLSKMHEVVSRESSAKKVIDTKMILVYMLSAVFFHCLVPEMYITFLGTSMKDLTTQYRYVDTILDFSFGKQ